MSDRLYDVITGQFVDVPPPLPEIYDLDKDKLRPVTSRDVEQLLCVKSAWIAERELVTCARELAIQIAQGKRKVTYLRRLKQFFDLFDKEGPELEAWLKGGKK